MRLPLRLQGLVCLQVVAGKDKSLAVEREAIFQPCRVRRCPSHHEDVPNRAGLDNTVLVVSPLYALKMKVALQIDDLSATMQIDFGIALDSLDQVARHGVGEYQHVDLGSRRL